MMNDWSDRMRAQDATELWERQVEGEAARRTAAVERELRDEVARQGTLPLGFFDAMQHFLTLREKMFPGLPADPAWKILVTLARTEHGSGKASATGIAYGADVPLATALRYIATMETQGIIERVPNPADKRQVIIRLTDEGRHRLETIAQRWSMRLWWLLAIPLALVLYASKAFAGF